MAGKLRRADVHGFELRASSDVERVFEGYGSVFGVTDSYDERVAPGAFKRSLAGRQPAMLWQHDAAQPIGVWEEVREDAHGLFMRGRLSNTPRGREAYTLLKDNAIGGLSIGFATKRSSFDETTGIRTLTDVELYEVSIVTFPANEAARVTDVRSVRRIGGHHEVHDLLDIAAARLTALHAGLARRFDHCVHVQARHHESVLERERIAATSLERHRASQLRWLAREGYGRIAD